MPLCLGLVVLSLVSWLQALSGIEDVGRTSSLAMHVLERCRSMRLQLPDAQ